MGEISSGGPMFHCSVCSNGDFEGGGNGRAIESNWGINRASRKFWGDIEKEVIVQGSKV